MLDDLRELLTQLEEVLMLLEGQERFVKQGNVLLISYSVQSQCHEVKEELH
jgi:hypothetical protein